MRQKNKILLSAGVFLLAYFFLLVLWIQVKPYYGRALAGIGAHLAAGHTKCNVEKIHQNKDVTEIQFSRPVMTAQGMGDIIIDMTLRVSNYSFNVPLTFALVAALYVYFRWKPRYIMEAGIILVGVHLLYIFAYLSLELLKYMTYSTGGGVYGIKAPSQAAQFFFEFLWAFTDNMIIQFEPFLVAVYFGLRSRAFRTVAAR